MKILALDLATVSGWAVGEPGDEPDHGSIRFAKPGASHEAIFWNASMWIDDMIERWSPEMVVWEAPLAGFKSGKTTNDVTTILYGLPAVIGASAYSYSIYDVRKASTKDVRNHFISCNPKRKVAKELVMRQCRAMGWDVKDDNEADALATWHYQCSIIDPKQALKPVPLFGRGTSR